jgi:hypothetical protein
VSGKTPMLNRTGSPRGPDHRGSKDLDWEKIPLVYDLNYCVNPEEASVGRLPALDCPTPPCDRLSLHEERFRISGFLSYEDKVMETHGLSNALYETLLEQGRIVSAESGD